MSTEPLTPSSWNDFKREEVDTAKVPPMIAYIAAKSFAEKAFWEVAKQNPDVDFTASEHLSFTSIPRLIYKLL